MGTVNKWHTGSMEYRQNRMRLQEDKTFGCCRYLWNRMLGDHNTLYSEIGEVPANTPADYKDLDECIWLNEVDSLALANVQLNLDSAFSRFFKKTAHYPNFKSRKFAKKSYTTNAVYLKKKDGSICCNISLDPVSGLLKLPKHKDTVQLRLHRFHPAGRKTKIRYRNNGAGWKAILFHPDGVSKAGTHKRPRSGQCNRTGYVAAKAVCRQ